MAVETSQGILLFRVWGVYGENEIKAVSGHLDRIEAASDVTPDRIFDLSEVTDFGTNYVGISATAAKRQKRTYKNRYRSAFVAPTPLQIGFVRMYQTLAANDWVEFAIFPTRAKAEAWLLGKSPL